MCLCNHEFILISLIPVQHCRSHLAPFCICNALLCENLVPIILNTCTCLLHAIIRESSSELLTYTIAKKTAYN